jgi:hypothetical protein
MRNNDPEDETLEGVVRDDPRELDNCIEQVHRGLQSDDLPLRRDAGRAFRVAAEQTPETVEPYFDTVVGLLSDRSGSVQLSGAIAVAELATIAPATVAETLPELLTLLEDTDAPAIQLAVVRALTCIGAWSPAVAADADAVTADLLQTATPPIRTGVVTIFADVIIEVPTRFPETVGAMEDALDDESMCVRRSAAVALALVATTDQSALSSVEHVRDQVEALEAQMTADPRRQYGENITQAARTLRSLDDADTS